MPYSGKWSPSIAKAMDRAQRLQHARRVDWPDARAEDHAWRAQEDAEERLDVDRLDFDADGRL